MPSTSSMRREFNLRPGEKVGRAEITSCEMGHETKKKNQSYEYPCKIQFKAKDADKVKVSWMRNIGTKPRIIHSEYGSPYECWFEEPAGLRKGEKDTIVMTVKAVANRRRDIPTLRQIADQQKPPESPDEVDALKSDCKVVRSHFATSRCRTCHDKVLPGQMIAKPEKGKAVDTSRGWSHVHCLAMALNVVGIKQSSSKKKRGRPRKGEQVSMSAKKREAHRTPKGHKTKFADKADSKADTSGNLTRGRKRKATDEQAAKPGRKKPKATTDKQTKPADDAKSDQVASAPSGGDRAAGDGSSNDMESVRRKRQKRS